MIWPESDELGLQKYFQCKKYDTSYKCKIVMQHNGYFPWDMKGKNSFFILYFWNFNENNLKLFFPCYLSKWLTWWIVCEEGSSVGYDMMNKTHVSNQK